MGFVWRYQIYRLRRFHQTTIVTASDDIGGNIADVSTTETETETETETATATEAETETETETATVRTAAHLLF